MRNLHDAKLGVVTVSAEDEIDAESEKESGKDGMDQSRHRDLGTLSRTSYSQEKEPGKEAPASFLS